MCVCVCVCVRGGGKRNCVYLAIPVSAASTCCVIVNHCFRL